MSAGQLLLILLLPLACFAGVVLAVARAINSVSAKTGSDAGTSAEAIAHVMRSLPSLRPGSPLEIPRRSDKQTRDDE